jgi:hypothetical protein
MNGLCCVHSMQEEDVKRKEYRDMVRNAVKVEWERQKVLDNELRERQLREQGLDDASILAEQRRRLLMAAKIQASRQKLPEGSLDGQYNPATQGGTCQCRDVDTSTPKIVNRQRTFATPAIPIVPPSSLNQRIRSAPVWSRDSSMSQTVPVVSSLIDDEEEEDEDEEDMEEILLQ